MMQFVCGWKVQERTQMGNQPTILPDGKDPLDPSEIFVKEVHWSFLVARVLSKPSIYYFHQTESTINIIWKADLEILLRR